LARIRQREFPFACRILLATGPSWLELDHCKTFQRRRFAQANVAGDERTPRWAVSAPGKRGSELQTVCGSQWMGIKHAARIIAH
jgi:hypothetical protein